MESREADKILKKSKKEQARPLGCEQQDSGGDRSQIHREMSFSGLWLWEMGAELIGVHFGLVELQATAGNPGRGVQRMPRFQEGRTGQL